jgi:glucan biosynthesis protein C
VVRGHIGGRIEGLDAWRGMLMLGGPILHGAMLHAPHLLFQIIDLASASFRMGAFFAISGLLAGLNLRRRPPRAWLARHAKRVGIPALFGVAVLSPITSLVLRAELPAAAASRIVLFDWYHLWFLYALLVYGGLTYLAFTFLGRRTLARAVAIARCVGQGGVLFYLSTLGFLLLMTTPTIVAVMPAQYGRIAMQLAQTAAFAPLYGFGILMACSRSILGLMLRTWRLPAGVLACSAAGYLFWYGVVRLRLAPEAFANWDIIVRYAGEAICPPAASLLILRSALRIRRIGPWTKRLCAASFTLYLLHFPMLAVVNAALLRTKLHYLAVYVVAVTATTIACITIHFGLVSRSAWLSLLLNGRSINRQPNQSARVLVTTAG